MMEKKTFIITTGQNSEYVACQSPIFHKFDDIQVKSPESVAILDGHVKLYDEEALDKARHAGVDAAWNLARKIICSPANGGYSVSELHDIFGSCLASDCIRNYSCREVAEKINEWEEKKANTIHVGDVLLSPANTKALVTCIIPGYIYLVYSDGSCNRVPLENINELYKKTGQSFDPSALLDKLKEENDG
jgi:hypothetical protein